MARLQEYSTFKEKSNLFDGGDTLIRTKDEFDVIWKKLLSLESAKTSRFRGSGEAKYKLFNSAQRFWQSNELHLQGADYHHFIKSLIDQCYHWNGRTVSKFFDKNGIQPNNVLAYLSYMQHYGVPTPLLDFTEDPFIGLYFAMEKADNAQHGNLEIDHYASLYMVEDKDPLYYNETTELEAKVQSAQGNIVEIDYDKDLKPSVILFVANLHPFKVLNNTNIVNQQGTFFFVNNPTLPIEEAYQEQLAMIVPQNGAENTQALGFREYFATCWNFHKSLRPYIMSKLQRERGIMRAFVYPDNLALREQVLYAALEEL
jgi:FRG domain